MQKNAVTQQTPRVASGLPEGTTIEGGVQRHANQGQRQHHGVCLPRTVVQQTLGHGRQGKPQPNERQRQYITRLEGVRHNIQENQSANRHDYEAVEKAHKERPPGDRPGNERSTG